jgi:hypothetical protein
VRRRSALVPSVGDLSTDATPGPGSIEAAVPPPSGAVVLQFRGRLALLRRGRHLDEDPGRWHCVTAACAPDTSPLSRALEALFKETGVGASDLSELREGPALLVTTDLGTTRLIRPYLAVTEVRRLTLDSEHDAYRWATPAKMTRFDGRAPLLDEVVRSLIAERTST